MKICQANLETSQCTTTTVCVLDMTKSESQYNQHPYAMTDQCLALTFPDGHDYEGLRNTAFAVPIGNVFVKINNPFVGINWPYFSDQPWCATST